MSEFRLPRGFSIANRLVARLIRWGVPMGSRRTPMALLTVRGRKTGLERTTPVAVEPRDDGWLLVAVYGVCDWSRNLEAAKAATITQRGRRIAVKAKSLEPVEAAPVLREVMARAPRVVRRMTAPYFTADTADPLEKWTDEAIRHPVFLLTRADHILGSTGSESGTRAAES